MTSLRKIPAAVAALLLAAHFLRAGNGLGVTVCIALAGAVFLPGRVPGAIVRLGLAAGLILWVVTLISLAAARSAAGQPYGRLAVILGAVAVFTGLAALILPPARPPVARIPFPTDPAP